ncbi:MAG: hypothetical protein QOI41_4388, partial [Myxococcales bacterium]|nr:hypothetical protein [Myxococcales bacterium]
MPWTRRAIGARFARGPRDLGPVVRSSPW